MLCKLAVGKRILIEVPASQPAVNRYPAPPPSMMTFSRCHTQLSVICAKLFLFRKPFAQGQWTMDDGRPRVSGDHATKLAKFSTLAKLKAVAKD